MAASLAPWRRRRVVDRESDGVLDLAAVFDGFAHNDGGEIDGRCVALTGCEETE